MAASPADCLMGPNGEPENREHNGPSLVQYGDVLAVMASGLLGERGGIRVVWTTNKMNVPT